MKKLILSALLVSTASAATIDRDGVVGINKTFSAQTLHHGKLAIGLHSHIVDDVMQLQDGIINREGTDAQLNDYLTLSSSIFLGIGMGPYTDIGLALPLYFEKFKSDNSALNMDEQYQGDLRYRLKVQLPFKDIQVLNVAIMLGGSVPTQFDNRGVIPRELEYMTDDPAEFNEGSSPFGAGRPTFLAGLGLTLDLSQVAEKFQFLWHFNLGVRKTNVTKQPPFQDILFWSTAAEYEASSFIRFFTEFYHEARFDKIGDAEFSTEPTTLTLGGVAQTPVGLDFYAGLELGFNDNFIPVQYTFEDGPTHTFAMKGSPDLSMFFEVTWNGFILKQDNDGDGIKNKEDKCPDEAEDKDGYQDEDGCPETDNDRDGIADANDKCPMEAEDKDGFQDNDGCPEVDNDKDGIPDLKDRCPNDAQGADGKEGCPNQDKDSDGIVDVNDKCPSEAEDRDGFEDEDGCPEADNDKDGIADANDKCPGAPETFNKFEDEDGCPDKVQEIVKTMVLKGVNFKTGSAELTPESFRVLDDIVPQLQANPNIQFEVAGHTDNRGNATKNQMLSQARAQSVANYFISKGVDTKQLKVIGYGSSRPIGPNTTAEGRALNRRVELNRLN
ncbi:MAG TPA: OmpA family protein [Fibrobacteria bacterium]|nr:OmpA family protein [Fibrobacteria bacterium]